MDHVDVKNPIANYLTRPIMQDFGDRNSLSKGFVRILGAGAIVLFLIMKCSPEMPKKIIVNGVQTDSGACLVDFEYVTAHKENEEHIDRFTKGLDATLQNKPNIMIDRRLGICGQAADDALIRYVYDRYNNLEFASANEKEFEAQYAILKSRAGQQ